MKIFLSLLTYHILKADPQRPLNGSTNQPTKHTTKEGNSVRGGTHNCGSNYPYFYTTVPSR